MPLTAHPNSSRWTGGIGTIIWLIRPELATLAARPQPQSKSFLRRTAYLQHSEVDALRSIAHLTHGQACLRS